MARAGQQREAAGRVMRLFRVASSGLLRDILLMPRERIMALDHGPWLGPVRLWKIFEEEAGRSAQAHAANPGATLAGATTICSLQPTFALPNEIHACRPLETTSRSTAREPDDTAAHHMAFRSYIFWRSLVENRDNQATEPCSVNHGDMVHLPKARLRRQAFTGKTLTAVGDPETRAHGSCLKSVTRVSVDGKSGCLRVSRFAERTHDPGSCTRGGYRISPRLGTK